MAVDVFKTKRMYDDDDDDDDDGIWPGLRWIGPTSKLSIATKKRHKKSKSSGKKLNRKCTN